ncbi:MAG: hypothetical protein QOC56_2385 [Alphaproteobacteria bacterium]|nr:hypothetical protein [Alphaproteobacteria bacterium]
MRKIELAIEAILFQCRWILAPFYIGLAVCLLVLLIHFGIELFAFVIRIHVASQSDVILGVLSLIDIVFTGNLVLIVILSGYENFVSRIDAGNHDRPQWMTKVDFGGLKQKLMTSIVAISAIQVLKAFMNVEQYDTSKLGWLVGIHLVFLGSLLAVVLADRLSDSMKAPEEKSN